MLLKQKKDSNRRKGAVIARKTVVQTRIMIAGGEKLVTER